MIKKDINKLTKPELINNIDECSDAISFINKWIKLHKISIPLMLLLSVGILLISTSQIFVDISLGIFIFVIGATFASVVTDTIIKGSINKKINNYKRKINDIEAKELADEITKELENKKENNYSDKSKKVEYNNAFPKEINKSVKQYTKKKF